MKVLVAIFEELVPISGGGTPRISSVVRAFVRRGHEVYVACSTGTTREETIAALQCRDVLPLPGVSRLDRRKMLKYLYTYPWNMAKLANYARKIQPDLIVSHNSVAGYGAVLSHSLGSKGLTVLDLTDVLFERMAGNSQGYRAPNGGGRLSTLRPDHHHQPGDGRYNRRQRRPEEASGRRARRGGHRDLPPHG